METYERLIPLEAVEVEIVVVNSRFISSLSPAKSVDEARAFISEIKKRFPDATHHVPAFVIGHGNSIITHSNDDGEPSGTAGRPALAVLQGSGLGNVVVVVTRYFGGTKLGTGGLVKAYGDAVREVLLSVKKAVLIPSTTLIFAIPYRLYDQVVRLMEEHNGLVLETEFMEDITITVQFKDEKLEDFQNDLRNLSNGQVDTLVLEHDPESVFPV